MKIKIKITLLTNLQAVDEICLFLHIFPDKKKLHLIKEFQFSASVKKKKKKFTALLWNPTAE